MSDTTTSTDETTETETPPEEQVDEASTDEGAKPDEAESETPPGEDDEDDDDEASTELDLDGAKKALAKVRKSEAKMRTRLRDIEAQLAEAKTPEEIEALLDGVRKDTADEARALLVENVALKHGLPEELAARLKGDTREELEADAKELAKFAPSDDEDPDLAGGLDPTQKPGSEHAELVKQMQGRRRR